MFKLFSKKDPVAQLEKSYARKLEEARDAQRGGRMPDFAELSAEAEQIRVQLEELERRQAN